MEQFSISIAGPIIKMECTAREAKAFFRDYLTNDDRADFSAQSDSAEAAVQAAFSALTNENDPGGNRR